MNADTDRIVITGMGAVSAYGCGVSALGAGLQSGKSSIDLVGNLEAALPCRIGAAAPGIIPCPASDVPARTRAAIMALAAASEAFDQAGLTAGRDTRALRLHASVGWGPYDLDELYRRATGGRELDPHFSERTQCGHGEAVLQSFFHPELGVAVCLSACAASTQALGRAFHDLKSGRAGICLAGGADSRLHVPGIIGYAKLGALATGFEGKPDEACRPFDAKRSGFVIGEGSAFVVMETLQHARDRGAVVLAEMLSVSTTTDAFRLTDPRPDGQVAARCIRDCLERAGLEASGVDYIQAHGTGTPANDRAEVASLKAALGAEATRIPVSSLKPYFGHLSMAAGALETVSSIWMLQNQFLAPCLNLDEPEEGFDLAFVRERKPGKEIRIVLKNSFGFGGQNACLLLRCFNEKGAG